jgi:hypothetical protein
MAEINQSNKDSILSAEQLNSEDKKLAVDYF